MSWLQDDATIFLAIAAFIGLNQVVIRVAALRSRGAVFWSVQVLNLVVASLVIWFGIPGFERWPIISWIFALIILFRIIQNNTLRTRYLRGDLESNDEQRARKAAEIREKLGRAEEADDAS